MSAYEDIGLSYVELAVGQCGTLTLANPIAVDETFFAVCKYQVISTNSISSRHFSIGSGATNRVYVLSDVGTTQGKGERTTSSGTDYLTVDSVYAPGSSRGIDGETHIAVLQITSSFAKLIFDSYTKSVTDSSLKGVFSQALTRIVLNGKITGESTQDSGANARYYFFALYSSLSQADMEALFNGASPLTVGTLRSGDSFWDFDGDGNEYNGGTPFTFTGTPTFVQPAYPDTLEVTESYLSLDSTQYAQAPISTPIDVSESVWWARKFRITGGTSDPYLATLGNVAGGQSAVRIAWLNSNNKIDIYRIESGSVAGTYSNSFTVADGQDHIVVMNIKPSLVDIWIDGAVKITDVTGTALSKVMNTLTINAQWDGAAAIRKGSQRVYWEYLYNTLSPADIAALMQGEHPASVGNVRQGYNLAGDDSELNGGPSLVRYNAPQYVVPATDLIRLISAPVSRVIASKQIVSRQIVSR